ncbi:MAG: prepilin-type N-terminal cleavage/methylation domain-containing protein [Planctomycetota bacterium]
MTAPHGTRAGTRAPMTGYTLIELVLVIAVLAIAATPVLGFLASGVTRTVRAEQHTLAHFLAVDGAERLLADRHNPARGLDYVLSAYTTDAPSAGFTRSYTFREVSTVDLETSQSGTGFYQAIVRVTHATGDTQVKLLFCRWTEDS